MDSPSEDFGSRLLIFLRSNLLIVSLGLIGIIVLLYGLIQSQKPKEEIKFEAAETIEKTEKQAAVHKIMVDVSGAVVKPGVYRLDLDSRIQDAIESAGGLSAEADAEYLAKNVNLAQKLTDGGKLYIPKVGEQMVLGAGSSVSASGLININTASPTELDSLPGVGPATSAKIIQGRPYGGLDELLSKKIVSQKVFNSIKDKISTY